MIIKDILNVFSPSGEEEKMREFLTNRLSALGFNAETDNLGSVICRKQGGKKRICIECGIDTSGIMITSASNGDVRFAAVGALNVKSAINKRVVFSGGGFGYIRSNAALSDEIKAADLYIETKNKDLKVGDFGAIAPEYFEENGRIYANHLSSLIGCALMLDVLENVKTNDDICFFFGAQKGLGARGIRAFFGENTFETVISLSACEQTSGAKCGSGCIIVAKDKRAVSEPQKKRLAENIAKEENIPHSCVVTEENLFMENILITGSPVLGIAIPVSHKGENPEAIEISDVQNAAKLVCGIIDKL